MSELYPIDLSQKERLIELCKQWIACKDQIRQLRKYNSSDFHKPNAFQIDFYAAGATNRERLLSAANRSGKTFAGAIELVYHATGRYPSWWKGKRFTGPIRALVVGVSCDQYREASQRILLYGKDSTEMGTGAIPKDAIVDWKYKKDANDALDFIKIRYLDTEEWSYVQFVTHNQKWENIMGNELHVIWGDESLGNEKYYNQFLPRIATTNGIIYVTCTPEHGYTPIYRRFEKDKPHGCYLRYGSLYEVNHIEQNRIREIVESYPTNERPYRVFGRPFAGSGMVYPVAEHNLKHPWFRIPSGWRIIAGIDFGYSRSLTAVVWIAIDPSGCRYVFDRIAYRGKDPEYIAPHILRRDREFGFPIPMAWPKDGLFAERSTGNRIATMYKDLGVNMLPECAGFYGEDGKKTFSIEAGVQQILQLMHMEKFKILCKEMGTPEVPMPDPTMEPLFEEMRIYGRDDEGQIKKSIETDPHHWDAIRYAESMIELYATSGDYYDEEPIDLEMFSILN